MFPVFIIKAIQLKITDEINYLLTYSPSKESNPRNRKERIPKVDVDKVAPRQIENKYKMGAKRV